MKSIVRALAVGGTVAVGLSALERQSRRRRDEEGPAPWGSEVTTVQRASRYFGGLNLAIGALGLFGPTVRGNNDKLININPGLLLDFVAINWLHALLHAGFGVAGLAAGRSERASMTYMRATTVTFSTLATEGVRTIRGREGIHMMMGMAVDRKGNLIHTVWAATGLLFTLRPYLGQTTASQMGERTQAPEEPRQDIWLAASSLRNQPSTVRKERL